MHRWGREATLPGKYKKDAEQSSAKVRHQLLRQVFQHFV